MSIRNDTLSSNLIRFLERYTPPKDFSVQAQADETAALFRAIDRAAPQASYDRWWSNFEDTLAASLKTRAWPTVGDVVRAAERVPQPRTAEQAAHVSGDWRDDAAMGQLRKWLAGTDPVPGHFVTADRLRRLGLTEARVRHALAFAADPANQGIAA